MVENRFVRKFLSISKFLLEIFLIIAKSSTAVVRTGVYHTSSPGMEIENADYERHLHTAPVITNTVSVHCNV